MVGRLRELGVSEFGLYFPILSAPRPACEKIARDVIPKMKG